MTTFGRIFRKLFFGGLFIFFIVGSFFLAYEKYFPALPGCGDNIQNQNETGIDCGGVCGIECPPPESIKQIRVDWAKAIYSDIGEYDLAAKITNLNKNWGLAEFSYEFVLRDENGNEFFKQDEKSYIIPDSYDYIIIASVKIDKLPSEVKLNIIEEGQKWRSVSENYTDLSLLLPFREKRYTTKDENGFSSASAILTNATTYDFDRIDIKVVLFDKNNEVAGVNISNRRTMQAGEEQYFRLPWRVPPQREVFNTDFKATTNIFDSQNFMIRYGTDSKIREYR